MYTLSALDAISPAITRTKHVLFAPFRKGRTWKLCATAYLSMAGTVFLPFPLAYLAFVPAARQAGGALVASVVIAGALAMAALFLVIFYLCSRTQFVLFDLVLYCGEFVAPAWRKYGRQARRWTVFKVACGTVFMLLCAAPVAAYAHYVLPLIRSIKPGQPPPPNFVAAIFAGYGVIVLLFGSFFAISSIVSDFMVPLLAPEETTLAGAFRHLLLLVRREPGQFAGYAVTKIALGILGYMGAVLAFEIIFVVAILVLALIAGVIGFVLHLVGVPKVLLVGLGVALAVVFYLFFLVYGLLLMIGPILTFLQAYTLYFLGGRYPQLGVALERSEPPSPMYVPITYYPPPAPPPAS